jgi:hypothetical protein
MSINASRFYGIGFCLLTVGAFAACSSSGDDNGTNNTGGTSTTHAGTGNTTAGTANTTGGTGNTTGGTGNTTAGTSAGGTSAGGTNAGGSGGGNPNGPFTCAAKKPTSALITEFADLGPNPTNAGQFVYTLGLPGGTFGYQPKEFVVSDASKSLNIKGKVMNYDGFGVYFTDCTDASAYTGVSFNIKGMVGPGGKLNFRFQSNADMAVNVAAKKGGCVVPAGTADPYPICHPPTFDIPVSAGGGVVEVKFSDVMGGVPVATVDGKDLVGLEWAFAWAGPTDTAYDVDVTLDDIKLTGGPSGGGTGGGGGGGTGGSGGAAGGGTGGGGTGGSGGTH